MSQIGKRVKEIQIEELPEGQPVPEPVPVPVPEREREKVPA